MTHEPDRPEAPDPAGPRRPARGRRRSRRPALALLLGAVLVAAAGIGLLWNTPGTPPPPGTGKGPGAAPGDGARGALPFDLPGTRQLRAGPHLVFAHYFPPFPLSLDDAPADRDYYTRNYLSVGGEGGKHAAYGGLLRDRPLPVAPSGGDYELTNMEREVRTARDAGIDGFSVDILTLSGPNWDRVRTLLRAAQAVDPGFKIMLMPDMAALDEGPEILADALATLAAAPAAFHLSDGRLVVSPFKAEAREAGWWKRVLDRLAARHGVRTALVPLFLDFRGHAEQFAPLSYGFSAWGNRSHTGQSGSAGNIDLAHRLGKRWIHSVAVQDARPNQGVYDEAGNTALLRTTWDDAIDDGADWVQLTTWNDYSESTHIAPSPHDGHAYLDLCSYYLTRFKTGRWPPIVRDTVYVTSRVQFAGNRKAARQRRLMEPRPGTATPRDTVEVLTFLTADATLDTTVGGVRQRDRVPAGVHPTLLPLRAGHSTATVTRGGHTTATVTTRYPVRTAVDVQDLQYYAVTSGRPAEAGHPG
ncbi:endo-1,3-alpha-glucanase family glycosylhydrolase [Streptomyces sp. TS71-3]|uniref:endo-1,3-alpha-glucanase family glycosylhydrolase n=1 Tax=Streptomyces sp. TS71-3 TaxID=2733862 RepID=UPI001B0182AB|nr:endo-1,3-alpha-glucanase family glycosylhydrolase [Streptomyces sp. TS71-3]GHJ42041.1 hypothetical protein Sm713_76500 [Streptomyces sp. TS71-3]